MIATSAMTVPQLDGLAGSAAHVSSRIATIRSRIEGLAGGGRPAFPTLDDGAPAPGDARPRQAVPAVGSGPDVRVAGVAVEPASATDEPGGAGRPAWARGLPAAADRWLASIDQAAEAAELDPALLASVVEHESGFDQEAVSYAGAIGLAQLMPATAEALGVDPHDPVQNLTGGARYLREQLDRFGAPELALAAYNAGPGRVQQAGGVPRIPETRAYVDRVMTTWERTR